MLLNNIFGMLNTSSRIKIVEKISSVIEMTLLMDFLLMDDDIRKLKKLLKLCKTFMKKMISNHGLLKIDRNMMSLFDNYNKIIKKCNHLSRIKLKEDLSDSDDDDDDDHAPCDNKTSNNNKTNCGLGANKEKSDDEYGDDFSSDNEDK